MQLRHLHYFLVVAEELSFARAAARVHIEPSPLSRAIKELESDLGANLLHRDRGHVRLTWAGQVFREEARRMIALMEDARTRVQIAASGYRGQLRIGLADRLAQPQLTQLLARCREEEPLVHVKLIEMTVDDMVRALDRDDIDAGFTLHGALQNGIVEDLVWTDRPVVAIPRNHPLLSLDKIPLQAIAPYVMILCHPELCASENEAIHRRFCASALTQPFIMDGVSGHEAMLMLVAAGYGIGIGLASQIEQYRHTDVIVRALEDDIPDTATFIARADKTPSNELRRFIRRAQRIGNPTSA